MNTKSFVNNIARARKRRGSGRMVKVRNEISEFGLGHFMKQLQ